MTHAAKAVRPVSSRILVRPDPLATTVGSIIIPESVREKHASKQQRIIGTVVAVGPGMPMANGCRWPMPDVKPGDRILFAPDGSYKLKLDVEHEDGIEEDVPHLMIRDTFVDGVLEP